MAVQPGNKGTFSEAIALTWGNPQAAEHGAVPWATWSRSCREKGQHRAPGPISCSEWAPTPVKPKEQPLSPHPSFSSPAIPGDSHSPTWSSPHCKVTFLTPETWLLPIVLLQPSQIPRTPREEPEGKKKKRLKFDFPSPGAGINYTCCLGTNQLSPSKVSLHKF